MNNKMTPTRDKYQAKNDIPILHKIQLRTMIINIPTPITS